MKKKVMVITLTTTASQEAEVMTLCRSDVIRFDVCKLGKIKILAISWLDVMQLDASHRDKTAG